jgi:hypothetical protein
MNGIKIPGEWGEDSPRYLLVTRFQRDGRPFQEIAVTSH